MAVAVDDEVMNIDELLGADGKGIKSGHSIALVASFPLAL